MPKRKARLANRTIWALEDILAECLNLRPTIIRAIDRAESDNDPAMMLLLARISAGAATIHAKAAEARRGEYTE